MEDDMSAENSFPKGKTSPACHQVSHADIELFEVSSLKSLGTFKETLKKSIKG